MHTYGFAIWARPWRCTADFTCPICKRYREPDRQRFCFCPSYYMERSATRISGKGKKEKIGKFTKKAVTVW